MVSPCHCDAIRLHQLKLVFSASKCISHLWARVEVDCCIAPAPTAQQDGSIQPYTYLIEMWGGWRWCKGSWVSLLLNVAVWAFYWFFTHILPTMSSCLAVTTLSEACPTPWENAERALDVSWVSYFLIQCVEAETFQWMLLTYLRLPQNIPNFNSKYSKVQSYTHRLCPCPWQWFTFAHDYIFRIEILWELWCQDMWAIISLRNVTIWTFIELFTHLIVTFLPCI